MPLVGFRNDGYDCFDEGRLIAFSEDNSCTALFDYIEKDLTELPELLEQHFNKRINTDTFVELNEYWIENTDFDKIIRILKSCHPYYKYEYRDVIIKAIGNYLNAMLIHAYRKGYDFKRVGKFVDYNWYFDIFKALTVPLSSLGDKYPTMFFNQLRAAIGDDVHHLVEEQLLFIPSEPKGFQYELITQRSIKQMLYWVLDLSAQFVGALTITQRTWFYANMFKRAYNLSEMKVLQRLSLKPNIRYRAKKDHSRDYEQINEIENIFAPLYSLCHSDMMVDNLTQDIQEALNNAVDYANAEKISGIYEEYEVDSLHQLLYLEVLQMINTNKGIRRCENCGRYYVVTDRRNYYCKRRSEKDGKTCRDVGKNTKWKKKLKEDELTIIFNRARKTHHARIKLGIMTKDDYDAWLKEAHKKKLLVKSGELSFDDFKIWLKR